MRSKTNKARLARLQEELRANCLREAALQNSYDEEREKTKEYASETWQLAFKRYDLAMEQSTFERIAARIQRLEIEQRAPARVTKLRAAEAPKTPVTAFPLARMLLASLGGFCLPFLVSGTWELWVRRVTSARQLQRHCGLPVLGAVARLTRHKSAAIRRGQQPRLFEESIERLRARVTLAESLQDARVLAVTSAVNNEGKTCVALQLAFSFARASGELTLLVDGDVRSPDVHKVLQTSLEPGLVGVLSGQCMAEEAIITDWSEGKLVHVLPAGRLRGSPHAIVRRGPAKSLLETLRASYRYIIIDTPPVLAAPDSLVIAKEADACLLCCRQDVSRLDHARAARESLREVGATIAGLVLNGVPCRVHYYGYGPCEDRPD